MPTPQPRRVITSSIPQMDWWDHYLADTVGSKAPFRVVDAEKLVKVPRNALAQWCDLKGIYVVVTTELVAHIKDIIKDRPALEICAGVGTLGAALGIPQVDLDPVSGTQVVKEDAQDALARLKPDVVVGAWTMQRGPAEVPHTVRLGVDEEQVVAHATCYVLVGNRHAHAYKKVLKLPHTEQHYDWIVSRSQQPQDDVIWTWGQ